MGCITRECLDCGHIDGLLPVGGVKYRCPKCGGKMKVDFDEEMDHDENQENSEPA